jgi:RNA recognition motif-containing protein
VTVPPTHRSLFKVFSETQKRRSTMAHTIFAGSLSPEIEEQDIEKLFARYGDVLEVHIFYDDEGKSRGFAFVEMLSPGQADDAIEGLDGRYWKGRRIRVSEARRKRRA